MRTLGPVVGQLGGGLIAVEAPPARATSVVILSSKAGSFTPEVEAKIRHAFADSLIVEFDPKLDLQKLLKPNAKVVVAGGDGTIGWVVRRLVDKKHPLGIVSMGTFNNFAKSLHLPTTIDAAIRVVKEGKPHPITLGRVNGTVFLEAAAIGMFGDTIAAGDAAKDLAFGAFADAAMKVLTARRFKYELSGDIRGDGSAMSLVFTNTKSIGSQMPVSDKTPEDPFLELSIHAGSNRTDIVKRVLARAVLSKDGEDGAGQRFRFRKLDVTTRPRVRIYADNILAGRTPASITAEVSALKVILPQ
jgi:diacylglycerol kinase family enzyme